MIFFRVIPIILIENKDCIKTFQYNKKKYLGDPINIIKIFNDLGVDEIIILNLDNEIIDYEYFRLLSEESFVPLSFGGGIKNIESIKKILSLGYEKIILNSALYKNINFLNDAIKEFGSSTISVSINIKKNFFGNYYVYDYFEKKILKHMKLENCYEILNQIEPGELIFNFVDFEGTRNGYDFLKIDEIIQNNVGKNIVINGGAKNFTDILELKKRSISGAAASSLFSFMGSNDAVLINYLDQNQKKILDGKN
jgi:cyclase